MDKIIDIISIFTIGTKLLLCLLLAFRKNNALPVYVLIILLLIPGITALTNYLMYYKLYNWVWLVHVQFMTILSLGPFLYIYTKMLLGQLTDFKPRLLLLFAPSILYIIVIIYHYSLPISEQRLLVDNFYSDLVWYLLYSNLVLGIYYFVFLIISIVNVLKTEKVALQVFSNLQVIKLKFIKEFLFLSLAIAVVALPISMIMGNEISDLIVLPVAMNIYTFYIYYQSINNGAVFNNEQFEVYQAEIEPLKKFMDEKINHSKLTDDESTKLYKSLLHLFELEKPWLEPELKLSTIAYRLNVSLHKLSEVINHEASQNFNEFVNEFRIRNAIKILEKDVDKKMKIENIGYDCGFNTKSNFYKIFKYKMHTTPAEYRDQYIQNQAKKSSVI